MSIVDTRFPLLDIIPGEKVDNSASFARRQGHDLAWEKNYFDELARSVSGQEQGEAGSHTQGEAVAQKTIHMPFESPIPYPGAGEGGGPVSQRFTQEKGRVTRAGGLGREFITSMHNKGNQSVPAQQNTPVTNERPTMMGRQERAMASSGMRSAMHLAAKVSTSAPRFVIRGDGEQVKVWMRDRLGTQLHAQNILSELRSLFMSMGLRLTQFSLNGSVYYSHSQPAPVVDELKIEQAE